MIHTCEQCGSTFRRNRKHSRFCEHKCYSAYLLGKKLSKETRKKQSDSKQGYIPVNVFKSGDKHPMFKKDRSKVNPRWSAEYSAWRKEVFERDGHACVKCGATKDDGVLLDADHIKPFASNQNKRFDVKNGRVLCRPCHRKEPTWGMKSHKQIDPHYCSVIIDRWQTYTGKQATLK